MNVLPTNVCPGTVLGLISEYLPGLGTHVYDGQVVASLLGRVQVVHVAGTSQQPAVSTEMSSSSSSSQTAAASAVPRRLNRITTVRPSRPEPRPLPTVSVARPGRTREVLPEVGNVVLCRVLRLVLPRQAIVSIELVGDTVLQTQWQGIIRSQDIRSTEKDKVKIEDSFRPGDVVRAQVISLGDQSNYYLSTASNELGVIMAASEAGNDMVPLNWKEYRDPVTEAVEPRKVAKP